MQDLAAVTTAHILDKVALGLVFAGWSLLCLKGICLAPELPSAGTPVECWRHWDGHFSSWGPFPSLKAREFHELCLLLLTRW